MYKYDFQGVLTDRAEIFMRAAGLVIWCDDVHARMIVGNMIRDQGSFYGDAAVRGAWRDVA